MLPPSTLTLFFLANETYIDGFMLSGNEWDYTTLDHLILPTASKTQREILEEDGFLGYLTSFTYSSTIHITTPPRNFPIPLLPTLNNQEEKRNPPN